MADKEAILEDKLIHELSTGDSQWTYRADLKTEDDLWANIREKLSNMNVRKLDGHPITEQEMTQIKSFIEEKAESTYKAAVWLSGERGLAQIPLMREDAALGQIQLDAINNRDIAAGHSTYEIINQYQSRKKDEYDRDRRFDVTLLINGFPMIHIELKNQSHPYKEAFNQIKKYLVQGKFRGLFGLVQMFVVSNGVDTRYIAANDDPEKLNEKFLSSWVDKNNKPVRDYLQFAHAALNIPQAHLMIGKYSVIDEKAKKLLLLRPYQIHAIEAVKAASARHESGYVWHTTGSGKTITSFHVTRNLLDIPSIDKSIFLIDRKDLDQQTSISFASYAAVTGDRIAETEDTAQLEQRLKSKDRCIIIATRQKLDCLLKRCNEALKTKDSSSRYYKSALAIKAKNVAFIVDECHRAVSDQAKKAIDHFFNSSTKKALWYGFTGTPIFVENKKAENGENARTTYDQYGECLHAYTIKEALNDGAVLGFQIQSSGFSKEELCKLALNLKVVECEQDAWDMDRLQLEDEVFKRFSKKSKGRDLYDSPEHRREVIDYIVNKSACLFRLVPNGESFEAILTCSSIDIAQKYYKEFKQFIKEGKVKEKIKRVVPDFPKIAITYSVGENEDGATANQQEMEESLKDYNSMFGTNFNVGSILAYNKDLNDRLARKHGMYMLRENQLDLVIVVDRLLTGFDAPMISTLFIDRQPMSPQGIIQAFSRTNRIFNDKKAYGQIVTFQTPERFKRAFEKALNLYAQGGADSVMAPSYAECKQRLKNALAEFKGFMADPSMETLDEHAALAQRRAFVKKFQAIDKAITAIKTYEEWEDEVSDALNDISPNLSSKGEPSTEDASSKELSLDGSSTTQEGKSALVNEDTLAFTAISKITCLAFTAEEFNKSLGQYKNLVQSLKDANDEDPECIDLDFDIDYELESVHADIKVDYQYLVSLIQKYIDQGASSAGLRQICDPAIDKYIASVLEKNPKLGAVLSSVWNRLKADPKSFEGKKALAVINERIDEIVAEKLKTFADEWCVALNDLEYAAKYYNQDHMELQMDYAQYKEKGGSLSKIRYMKQVREYCQELIVSEIIPLLQR